MPRYDRICDKCDTVTEIVRTIAGRNKAFKCPECGGKTVQYYGNYKRAPQFKPFWCEHLDTNPVYIESKAQYKQECSKRGMASVWLGNERKEWEPSYNYLHPTELE